MRTYPLQFLRGILMGSADIVPGVSGGTVALVLGIYHRLITNVRAGAAVLGSLARFRVREAWSRFVEVEWVWVIVLLSGIGTAVIALAHTIEMLLEEHPVRMAALFFGLVAGSVVVAVRLLQHPNAKHWAIVAATGVVTALALGARSASVNDPNAAIFFGSGAIAICAMILPGISGSLILLILGMYNNVLDAVNERNFVLMGAFLVGCVLGLAAFSTFLNWALKNHHNLLMAVLIGLMLGSLRALWPWPEGTAGTRLELPANDVLVPLVLAAVGFIAVIGVSGIADRADERDQQDEQEEHEEREEATA